jgi:hypothetical protein
MNMDWYHHNCSRTTSLPFLRFLSCRSHHQTNSALSLFTRLCDRGSSLSTTSLCTSPMIRVVDVRLCLSPCSTLHTSSTAKARACPFGRKLSRLPHGPPFYGASRPTKHTAPQRPVPITTPCCIEPFAHISCARRQHCRHWRVLQD